MKPQVATLCGETKSDLEKAVSSRSTPSELPLGEPGLSGQPEGPLHPGCGLGKEQYGGFPTSPTMTGARPQPASGLSEKPKPMARRALLIA